MIMLGDSGAGKTHNLRKFCSQILATASPELERIYILDAHEDINVPASFLSFSQSTSCAYNPLDVSADPHFGGVNRAINNFLGLLERSSRALGPQQESVLRTILEDVYAYKGYDANNPSTWDAQYDHQSQTQINHPERIYLDVPYDERDLAKNIAKEDGVSIQFDNDARAWWVSSYTQRLSRWPVKSWGRTPPTLSDVISAAELRLKRVFLGTDNKGVIALEEYCRLQASFARKAKNIRKSIASGKSEESVLEDLKRAGDKAEEAISTFIHKVQSDSNALQELIRYESSDTIKSILDRLRNLRATGVFRTNPPPFDDNALIWRYGLRAYADSERRMFVENLLERLFQAAVTRGEVDGIREIVVIDEAPIYLSDDTDHIISRIINQARKFGLAIILVAQSPTQFPDQILAGVGCKIILGLDPMFHQMAANKLALPKERIAQIVPRKLIVVNRKVKGGTARWLPVLL